MAGARSSFELFSLFGIAVLLLSCFAFVYADTQDQNRPPAKAPAPPSPKNKPGKPKLSDAVTRAVERARRVQTRVARVTVCPSELGVAGDEQEAYQTYVEFESGDIGLHQGNFESGEDQWLVISKGDLVLLQEVAERARRR